MQKYLVAAILAIVGLVSVSLGLKKPSSQPPRATQAVTANAPADCASVTTRPCYDRVNPGIIVGLQTKAGESAFQACLQSKSQSLRGFGQTKTVLSESERYQYCFEGKSTVQIRWFEGSVAPKPTFVCTKAPEFSPLSLLDPTWSMRDPVPYRDNAYTYYYRIEATLKSRSGTLFAAGYRTSSEGYVPVLHRSTDGGATWKLVALPDAPAGWDFLYAMVEDTNGVLYAGGTRLWKSTDDGNMWTAMPAMTDTYWGGSVRIERLAITKDNALIASFIFTGTYSSTGSPYFPYYYTKVYKSIDGGNAWKELFTHNPTQRLETHISALVEADDGSIVFRDYIFGSGNVYRYANGVVTKTFTDFLNMNEPHVGLLKARDSALYMIAADTALNFESGIEYSEPGHGLLAAYTSTDHGVTWTKLGMLPHSWTNQGPIIEAANGTLYAAAHSVCDNKGSLYKSTDKGATWSVAAASPEFGTSPSTESWLYFTTLSMVDISGRTLIGGNAPMIFSTR